MTIQYSPEAQQAINSSENKLTDALNKLRSQSKEPEVEVSPSIDRSEDVEIETPKEQKKEPRRSEFVQTDDPKIIERINDLYGQVKKSDAAKQMILEHNLLMEKKLTEYQEKLDRFERATKEQASDKVESELKSRLRTAREEHDLDTIEQVEEKLLDLRLGKRPIEKAPDQRAPTVHPAEQQILHNAAYVQNLSQEKDSVGNLVRPYLYDWHPDNKKAVDLFQSIPQEFMAAGKNPDIKDIIEVLDERMKGKKRQSQSVLGNDDGDTQPRRTIKLTEDQVYAAKRMGVSKERYAYQLSMINS